MQFGIGRKPVRAILHDGVGIQEFHAGAPDAKCPHPAARVLASAWRSSKQNAFNRVGGNMMSRVISALVLGLALAACGQGNQAATPDAPPVAQAPTDPSPRAAGSLSYDRFESVGDGIQPGAVVRDVSFGAGDAAHIEAIVTATDEPLTATLLDSAGQTVAQVAVPLNSEVQLTGRATSGQNTVRFTRQAANGEAARFGLRIRKVNQP